jgi:hypothetical protein
MENVVIDAMPVSNSKKKCMKDCVSITDKAVQEMDKAGVCEEIQGNPYIKNYLAVVVLGIVLGGAVGYVISLYGG